MSTPPPVVRDIHRIGGGMVDNLRLKPQEECLDPPGISVLRSGSPGDVARQIRATFPRANDLSTQACTIGSSSELLIQSAGFAIIHVPTRHLPNHYRLIHPDGLAGFNDANLQMLAAVFVNTTGH